MRRDNQIYLTIAIAILLCIVTAYISPYYVRYQLEQSIAHKDPDKLLSYVDTDVVLFNFKQTIKYKANSIYKSQEAKERGVDREYLDMLSQILASPMDEVISRSNILASIDDEGKLTPANKQLLLQLIMSSNGDITNIEMMQMATEVGINVFADLDQDEWYGIFKSLNNEEVFDKYKQQFISYNNRLNLKTDSGYNGMNYFCINTRYNDIDIKVFMQRRGLFFWKVTYLQFMNI